MNPHLFEEEFGSVFYYDSLLTGHQYIHLRKSINDHKYTIITMLGRREARHIVLGDGFPRLDTSRKRSV